MEGKKFNRLTFIKKTNERRNGNILWDCQCECGNITRIVKWDVTSGNTKSCGCFKDEMIAKTGKNNVTHGMRYTKIYKIWEGMKRRCNSEKAERYSSYGGKGITYIKEWEQFVPFHEWAINNGYEEGLSIDRIDVNGNYEPSNCQWIPLEQQAYNKTNSNVVEYKGKKITIGELAKLTNKPYHLLYQRIVKLEWTIEDAVKK